MERETLELIKERFESEIKSINWEIGGNKFRINQLAKKQRELKDTRKGLYEILRKLEKEIE